MLSFIIIINHLFRLAKLQLLLAPSRNARHTARAARV